MSQVTLFIGPYLFRVVSSHDAVIEAVRRELEEFVYESDAALGFKVDEGGGGMWSLITGAGEVLARSRSMDHVVGSLLAHLHAMSSESPAPGAVRFAFRGIIDAAGNCTVVGPRFDLLQPFIERQLTANGLAVVDARYVDVADGALSAPAGTPGTPGDGVGVGAGHTVASVADGAPLIRALVPWQHAAAADVTIGLLALMFAGATRSGSRRERLDAAVTLATKLPIEFVEPGERIPYTSYSAR